MYSHLLYTILLATLPVLYNYCMVALGNIKLCTFRIIQYKLTTSLDLVSMLKAKLVLSFKIAVWQLYSIHPTLCSQIVCWKQDWFLVSRLLSDNYILHSVHKLFDVGCNTDINLIIITSSSWLHQNVSLRRWGQASCLQSEAHWLPPT